MSFYPPNTMNQKTIQYINGLSDEFMDFNQPLKHLFRQALYNSGRNLVSIYMQFALRLDIVHRAPLPEGPIILAPNHPTTTDPFYLLTLLNKPMSILVTAGAFDVPIFGYYLQVAGHVPAVRGSGGATVDAVTRVIEFGRSAVIFPEGALSPLDGSFAVPHSGLARVALRTGAPVIPVGIGIDRDRIQITRTKTKMGPVTGHLYPAGPYAITGGYPIYLKGNPADREIVKSASAQVMSQIKNLTIESNKRLGQCSPRVNSGVSARMETLPQAAR